MPFSTPRPTVLAWRDHDVQTRALPGMSLGRIPLTSDSGDAPRLWALGVRRVELDAPVDLTTPGQAAARSAIDRLCLVRDLTARAVQVDWDLLLPPDRAEHLWKVLSHLHPPRTVTGLADADTALHAWRTRHYLCKLIWRQGPGFLQIRDRRWGDLRRFTADDPRYPAAVARLDRGARPADIPHDILDELTTEHLVLRTDDVVWWLPYHVARWLQEAMAV
ncbi:hypothetical protein AQI95_35820 [Streptomyces yokosukanensis]|uniref:Uncharacterized protein n=1 Tax=Streptomyces yokosukanensis TaxID=67386 RepID=A0A101NVK8_9ACTN|nr:DUF5825 family protein [Streptomyces yokosukanensis]KUN00127.1 hypothetical protein AQI95_35820 [Streptomyces yokosukanensis]